jgi:hypothetical protein
VLIENGLGPVGRGGRRGSRRRRRSSRHVGGSGNYTFEAATGAKLAMRVDEADGLWPCDV